MLRVYEIRKNLFNDKYALNELKEEDQLYCHFQGSKEDCREMYFKNFERPHTNLVDKTNVIRKGD